jgi:hypothetical protein
MGVICVKQPGFHLLMSLVPYMVSFDCCHNILKNMTCVGAHVLRVIQV